MYKQDIRLYVVLLVAYAFLSCVLNGIGQDVATGAIFLYVLFLLCLYDKANVLQDNRYHAISDVLAKTQKLYDSVKKELEATKAELEQYKNHQSEA